MGSNVTPLQIDEENNVVKIKVHQLVHNMNGNLLADEIMHHIFYLKNGKIAKFEIAGKPK